MPVARSQDAQQIVHSFMRDGKTNIAAGLAHLLAAYGERIIVPISPCPSSNRQA